MPATYAVALCTLLGIFFAAVVTLRLFLAHVDDNLPYVSSTNDLQLVEDGLPFADGRWPD